MMMMTMTIHLHFDAMRCDDTNDTQKVAIPEGALQAQQEPQHPIGNTGSVAPFSMCASKPVHGREQFVRITQSVELLPLLLLVCPAEGKGKKRGEANKN